MLRGTFEIINKVKDFYYMDHGYFKQSSRKFENNRTNVFDLDGYFRIVHNNFIHNGEGSFPNDRLNKLKLNFISQNK